MATETFHTLIARNKRNSALLIVLFSLVLVGLGLVIGYAWGGDMSFSVTVAVGAAILAFIMTMVGYYGGDSVLLSVSGARQVTKQEDPQLFNVIEELTLAAGTPLPRIFVIDDSAMNAFATGRNPEHATVAITTGLRQRLNRDELQGVMVHELSHVRNYDILFATLTAVMVGVIVMLADVFLRSLWYGGGRRRSSRRDGRGGGGQVILVLIALVLAILAPILAKLIQLAISRQREYLADAAGVELTRNPRGLASALAKLAGDTEVLEAANRATAPLYIVNPFKSARQRTDSLFSTHPDIRDRIQRLMSLES